MVQSLLSLFFERTTRQESGAGPDSANAGFFRKKNARRIALAALAGMIFGSSACKDAADENNNAPEPDTNPPVSQPNAQWLSEGMPSDLETEEGTTATLTFTSSKAGTYYYLVLAADASAPTADTVKAQGTAPAKGTSSAVAGTNTIRVTGLTVNTQYTAYIAAETGGSLSAVLTIANVNPVQPDTAPPELSAFAESETTTPTGTSVKITFNSSEAATYHYGRRLATAAAPDITAIQGSSNTGDAVAGSNVFYFNGLTPDVDNKLYIAAVDAAGNWSILYDYTVHPVKIYNPSIWTEVSLLTTVSDFSNIKDMIYGNGKYVAVGDANAGPNNGRIAYSSTGTGGWQAASIPAPQPNLSAVAYGGPAGIQKFVAVGTGSIVTSADGTNWSAAGVSIPSLASNELSGIIWAGSQFVAYSWSEVLTSPDGLIWTNRGTITSNPISKIIWDGSRLVALVPGGLGNRDVFSSTNGITWNEVIEAPLYETPNRSLAYGNGRYVIGGRLEGSSASQCTVSYSTDLTTWTSIPYAQLSFRPSLDIQFNNGRFYLLTPAGGSTSARNISWSTDGASWSSPVPTQVNYNIGNLKGMVYNDGKLFMLDYGGKIWYRTE
jgi:hypothetical protein